MVTLGELLSLYRIHRTPRKTQSVQRSDDRQIEMWSRFLGPESDPHQVSLRDWEAFIDARGSGTIDARGGREVGARRKPVRARMVEIDLRWLRAVFRWATRWRTEEGHYLMRENPVRGFEIPTERNPRRPVVSQARYEATRAVSDRVGMEIRWKGGREKRRSYLSELLDIVKGTGRRITAVCSLRYKDLRLEDGPHGAIRWPADTDKMGWEGTVPIAPGVRRAIDRVLAERPGRGSDPLFPAPGDPTRPMSRHLADKWLRKAEPLAGLEPLLGSLWHAYRRKWASERKHLPDVDVATAAGWRDTASLKRAYQQADPETMLRVVLGGG
jgi:integrase